MNFKRGCHCEINSARADLFVRDFWDKIIGCIISVYNLWRLIRLLTWIVNLLVLLNLPRMRIISLGRVCVHFIVLIGRMEQNQVSIPHWNIPQPYIKRYDCHITNIVACFILSWFRWKKSYRKSFWCISDICNPNKLVRNISYNYWYMLYEFIQTNFSN